jgi:hypothetical protein
LWRAATDTVADFRPGTDHLAIVDASGQPLATADIQALIAGATADAAGNAVLHLSPTHSITLAGITAGQLSADLFTSTPAPAGMTTSTAGTLDISAGSGNATLVGGGGNGVAPAVWNSGFFAQINSNDIVPLGTGSATVSGGLAQVTPANPGGSPGMIDNLKPTVDLPQIPNTTATIP